MNRFEQIVFVLGFDIATTFCSIGAEFSHRHKVEESYTAIVVQEFVGPDPLFENVRIGTFDILAIISLVLYISTKLTEGHGIQIHQRNVRTGIITITRWFRIRVEITTTMIAVSFTIPFGIVRRSLFFS
jgi:hypothetical protein